MAMITKDEFRRPGKIAGITILSTTAVDISINESDITFVCVSGNIWINPDATATANATAFLLTAGQAIDWNVGAKLSIISDATGATYEYIIYKS